MEEPIQQGQDGFPGVPSAEVRDHLLLDASSLAHGGRDAHVLVHGSRGVADFDGADERDDKSSFLFYSGSQQISPRIIA